MYKLNFKTPLAVVLAIIMICVAVPAGKAADYSEVKIGDFYYNLVDSHEETNERAAILTYSLSNPYPTYMETVKFPAEVEYKGLSYPVIEIGWQAFDRVEMGTLIIPPSMVYFGPSYFPNTYKAKHVIIEDSATSLLTKNTKVEGCESLYLGRNISAGNEYSSSPFMDNGIKEISISSWVTELPNRFFQNNKALEKISLPSSIENIGISTFEGCSALKIAELSSSMATIPSSAFGNCTSLVAVEMPNSILSIESSAFENCSSLATLNLPPIY